VPQGKPEQQKRVKAIPRGDFLELRKLLDGESRDALDVLARTGWHVTELVRFTNDGEVLPVRDGRAKGATLRLPRTKRGNPHLVEVPPDAARAAKRLLGKAWPFSRALAFTRLLKRKCTAAKVTPFGAGQFRHTVATWALEAGAPIEQIATFLNHQSPETTRRFYATHGVPSRIPTLPLAPPKRKGKRRKARPRLINPAA